LPDKPHIALLPGLDGTGELFFPIVPHLEKRFEVHVVNYTDSVSFDDYVESAERQLPDSVPLSLVAESFSGPVAIRLLARDASRFLASVLSATFCKSPLPLFTRGSWRVPEILFGSNPVSRAFLDLLVTGSAESSDIRSKSRELLKSVGGRKFKERIGLVDAVDVGAELPKIDSPLLYIQATRDRIVLPNSAAEMMKLAKNMEIAQVDGPHMILQVRAKRCADLIVEHVTSTASGIRIQST